MIEIEHVTISYDGFPAVQDVSFSVQKGEMFGILGPNGSGKTTLLKGISGTIPLNEGNIFLEEKSITKFLARQLAQKVAVLPQQSDISFQYTVEETVKLGRYPYKKGWFHPYTKEDEQMVKQAMEWTGVDTFKHRFFQTLSGGERQRVLLARALAQEPEVLLLDEPTNHLDIFYQMELFTLLRKWVEEKGLTVIAIFHDLNMASLFCDRLLLMDNGKVVSLDDVNYVLTEQALKEVYKVTLKRNEHPLCPKPTIMFVPESKKHAVPSFRENFSVTKTTEYIYIHSKKPLRTLSSAMIGDGYSWRTAFVNRHVHKNYHELDPIGEYIKYLQALHIKQSDAVAMMTAAYLEDAVFLFHQEDDFNLYCVVTAGISNAVDVSKSYDRKDVHPRPGTINIWLFIEGSLPDAAFVQAMMTATEAKTKALFDLQVLDPETNTLATGTSTDSVLIAATQTGIDLPYAGTITLLGRSIGKVVYEATKTAIERNLVRWNHGSSTI